MCETHCCLICKGCGKCHTCAKTKKGCDVFGYFFYDSLAGTPAGGAQTVAGSKYVKFNVNGASHDIVHSATTDTDLIQIKKGGKYFIQYVIHIDPTASELHAFGLIFNNKLLAGSQSSGSPSSVTGQFILESSIPGTLSLANIGTTSALLGITRDGVHIMSASISILPA